MLMPWHGSIDGRLARGLKSKDCSILDPCDVNVQGKITGCSHCATQARSIAST